MAVGLSETCRRIALSSVGGILCMAGRFVQVDFHKKIEIHKILTEKGLQLLIGLKAGAEARKTKIEG